MLPAIQKDEEVDPVSLDVLRRAYAAFNARDVEAALACMDPDVDWPNGLEGGYVYGHKAVHDYWVRQWHMIDPLVEPVSICHGEDGNIVVEVHTTVRDLEGNVLLEETVQHAYLILQGTIKRMEIRKVLKPAMNEEATPLPFE
ncbi:nuclear transport factor 2 family protein [Paraflavitalea sp. CAU 1676]|uniref:nuclear transport factor 2 family protein n=1 Tax=Paraflavitalea sp. CAU 1676 TaxID=3032598 RepID=UPI0023D97A4E|nr:nuclear transport factor 2 family protein [Paraflavitalea sp. CAU 1676]MDF2190860.1 nuclear transport factor 2 family protein [Paraflavitalea sp. CAU 1676]